MISENEKKIEQKLAEFRANKQKSFSKNSEKVNPLSNILNSIRKRITNESNMNKIVDNNEEKQVLIQSESDSETELNGKYAFPPEVIDDNDSPPMTRYDVIIIVIKILIYILCQTLALLLEFGAVFFIIALLLFICTNLRNRKRKRGELSAYSVFNPGCRSIHGAVTAKELEGQLTFGVIHHM